MNKHTPGPWKVTRWVDKRVSVDSGTHTIATLHDSSNETKANAQLIAAAPDLLAALEKIMQMTATSPLEACAYQGAPPKKWLREVAPALQARYDAVREAQQIARAAIAAAKEGTE